MEEKLHLSSKKALPSFAQFCAHNKSWAVKYLEVQKSGQQKRPRKDLIKKFLIKSLAPNGWTIRSCNL